jgi:hypothetical protein
MSPEAQALAGRTRARVSAEEARVSAEEAPGLGLGEAEPGSGKERVE